MDMFNLLIAVTACSLSTLATCAACYMYLVAAKQHSDNVAVGTIMLTLMGGVCNLASFIATCYIAIDILSRLKEVIK